MSPVAKRCSRDSVCGSLFDLRASVALIPPGHLSRIMPSAGVHVRLLFHKTDILPWRMFVCECFGYERTVFLLATIFFTSLHHTKKIGCTLNALC